ncbi:MAG: TonB-dependent receptor, partial [Gammaproteobacteria bacterium]|nr:TonB-dependent receptor [Gammaproteobacteria bacterium]
MKKGILASSILLAMGVSSVNAADDFDNAIIVTATRTAQTADQTLASVSVVTREDIERTQAQSVQEVLGTLPGVSVANNGGSGKVSSVFVRGTESDHLLVLVDGVKVGSVSSGQTAFQHIPVEHIEKIELVRGPRSAAYGSEAIGGVIQIFTKKKSRGFTPSFSMSTGSFGTESSTVGFSGGSNNSWYNLSVNSKETHGFDACAEVGKSCLSSEGDKDGFSSRSGTFRAGYRFNNGLEIDFHSLRSDSETEFDRTSPFLPTDNSTSSQRIVGTSAKLSLGDALQLRATLGQSRDESDTFNGDSRYSRFNSQRDSASFQGDITLGSQHIASLGVDYNEDRVDSSSVSAFAALENERTRRNGGGFFQYQGHFDPLSVQLNMRRDRNGQFGTHDTSGLALGYQITQKLRLNTSYATAFKAPTFNELYFPFYGSTSTRPEKSTTLEVGAIHSAKSSKIALYAYETDIDDLIAYDAALSKANNIAQVRIRGLELSWQANVSSWNFGLNFTSQQALDLSQGANDGKLLARRPYETVSLNLDKSLGRTTFGTSVKLVGKSYDDAANSIENKPYTTLDLRAEHPFSKDWKVQVRGENVLDESYQSINGYAQPGQSAYLTVR